MVLSAGLLPLLVPADAAELQARAVTGFAPAVLGVEGEQAGIELREAPSAGGAGAFGGEGDFADFCLALHQPIQRRDHLHHAFAEIKRTHERFTQRCLIRRVDLEVCDRQLDVVLLESRQPRPLASGQELAVHAQVRVALGCGPLREIGVVAFARHHQWRQQPNVFPAVIAQ